MITLAIGRSEWRSLFLWFTAAAVGAAVILGATATNAAVSPSEAQDAQHYSAEIQWTRYGIPHIEAKTFGGLGFGAGYAFAKENACLLFDTALTVRGERSKYLGPDGPALPGFGPTRNIDSDIFFRTYFDVDTLTTAYRKGSPDALALMQGYVAGANRYLAETGRSKLPAPCRDAAWIHPLAFKDMVLLVAQKAVEDSGSAFIRALLNASPASAHNPAAADHAPPQGAPAKPNEGGSNAYALGRDLVSGGHGLLVGNPHFPWQGHNRFFEMHLTIPGRLDAMGAALFPLPVVTIGFNRDVAWSHTVSTGNRFTLFELHLVPGHPLEYLVDGQPEAMHPKTVSVPTVDAHGVHGEVSHTVYETRFGPVVAEPAMGLNWTNETAFAFADAELANTRIVEQWLRLNQARNVSEVRDALADVQGDPWVNTLAADRTGQVLYADYSVVPDVTEAMIADCHGSQAARQIAAKSGIPVLDGSRASCDWLAQGKGLHRGVMPADRMPSLIRSDFVLNSNDSFWLANGNAPLTAYPTIIGHVDERQSWRTRMGYKALDALIADKRGQLGPDDMKEMILDDRDYVGELVMPDLTSWCDQKTATGPAAAPDVAAGCQALRGWDQKDTVRSGGAPFFREFWRRVMGIPALWGRPFTRDAPLATPTDLNLGDVAVSKAIEVALTDTVAQFRSLGLAPDTPLGAVQQRPTSDGPIAVPGGPNFEGILNNLTLGPLTRSGYGGESPLGSSYIQVVTWDDIGPVADALLTYGQSSDPSSPHYADQTRAYVKGDWLRLPFTQKAIATDPTLEVQRIAQ